MDYTAHNTETFKRIAIAYVNSKIKPQLSSVLRSVAQAIVDVVNGVPIEGTALYPRDTSNMLDATGVAVYVDGVVTSYIPTKKATKTQNFFGIKGIDGTTCLQQAIADGQTMFSTGIWIVLISATPYAYKVNIEGSLRNRGENFFENLKQTLLNDILTGIKTNITI
jgi:hypothetical protein